MAPQPKIPAQDSAASGPGRRPRSPRDPERTYRRILDVAVVRFDRSGPDGVVVTAIAREAGVSVGAVYHHFSGRSGLIAAARTEQFRRTTEADIAAVARAVEESADFAAFVAFNRTLLRRNRSPERARARAERLAALAAAADDLETAIGVRATQRRLTDALVAAAVRATARGWFRPDVDPRAWAVLIQGLLLGAVVADLDDELDERAWLALAEAVQDLAISERVRPG